MSVTTLKIIALIAMTIDHIGEFIPAAPFWFRWIGRISAPIFVFCAAEAMRYTHDRKKYISRLYQMAVLVAGVNFITTRLYTALTGVTAAVIENNIFGMLFNLALLIAITDDCINKKEHAKRNLLLYLLWQLITIMIDLYLLFRYPEADDLYYLCSGPLCNLWFGEGDIWILAGMGFYYLPKKNKILYPLCCAVYTIPDILCIPARLMTRFQYYGWDVLYKIGNVVFSWVLGYQVWFIREPSLANQCQWMMVFALVFILMYNGKYGRYGNKIKWLFYIYYPVHIVILYVAGNVLF